MAQFQSGWGDGGGGTKRIKAWDLGGRRSAGKGRAGKGTPSGRTLL